MTDTTAVFLHLRRGIALALQGKYTHALTECREAERLKPQCKAVKICTNAIREGRKK
ncbi:MAG: hypothetical protein Ta2A_12780 [Treponemataceae bacterium]|nr:MAG: hypothetical protein Ta2A_12780 [Treponemataceae bacterium]